LKNGENFQVITYETKEFCDITKFFTRDALRHFFAVWHNGIKMTDGYLYAN